MIYKNKGFEFRPLLDTYSDEVESIYIMGIYKNDLITRRGHKLICLENPFFIKANVINNIFLKKKVNSNTSTVNVLVGKRRVRVMDKTKDMLKGHNYIFKLTRESRSRKFLVSEIFRGH